MGVNKHEKGDVASRFQKGYKDLYTADTFSITLYGLFDLISTIISFLSSIPALV